MEQQLYRHLFQGERILFANLNWLYTPRNYNKTHLKSDQFIKQLRFRQMEIEEECLK